MFVRSRDAKIIQKFSGTVIKPFPVLPVQVTNCGISIMWEDVATCPGSAGYLL